MFDKPSYDGYVVRSRGGLVFTFNKKLAKKYRASASVKPVRARVAGPLKCNDPENKMSEVFTFSSCVEEPEDWELKAPYPAGEYSELVLFHAMIMEDHDTVRACIERGIGTEETLRQLAYNEIPEVAPELFLKLFYARRAAGVKVQDVLFSCMKLKCISFLAMLSPALKLAAELNVEDFLNEVIVSGMISADLVRVHEAAPFLDAMTPAMWNQACELYA